MELSDDYTGKEPFHSLRAMNEFEAYTISGELGYLYRDILEKAGNKEVIRLESVWLLHTLKEHDPTYQMYREMSRASLKIRLGSAQGLVESQ